MTDRLDPPDDGRGEEPLVVVLCELCEKPVDVSMDEVAQMDSIVCDDCRRSTDWAV